MSFPRYTKYKDSGVEWLGTVPEHWAVKRLKFLCDIQTGDKDTENAVEDGTYPFFVRSQTVERINSFAFDCEAVLTAGDGVGVGKVFHYHHGPFDFHQRVYMLNKFRQVAGRYLFHFLRENFYKVALEGGAKSTVDSLRRPLFTNFPVAVPPADEQQAIVELVEREAAKIDELVAEQRRLMELLKEKRQAVISHAVTRGLNPAAPLKPSGIEWLGDVPANWETSSFRHSVISIFNGLTADQIDESESTLPVTRIETISAGIIDEARLGFIGKEDARADRRLEVGDILFSNINSLNMIGNCAFYSGGREIYAGMNLLVLRPAAQRCPRWLYWLVRSTVFREVVESLAKPAINQASISQTSLYGIVIPVPSAEEQVEIIRFLDAETVKFDTLTAEAQRAIDLLQERRTALISAAVTGQMDVRKESHA